MEFLKNSWTVKILINLFASINEETMESLQRASTCWSHPISTYSLKPKNPCGQSSFLSPIWMEVSVVCKWGCVVVFSIHVVLFNSGQCYCCCCFSGIELFQSIAPTYCYNQMKLIQLNSQLIQSLQHNLITNTRVRQSN